MSRFKREMEVLERLGAENFAGLRADLESHGIDCEYEATGSIAVALEPHQGLDDISNQFHHYRLTGDNRILFGGYDAVYRYGGPVADRLDDHPPTFATLSQHFFTTFPQLEGLRFTHSWGGAIDTCSRFSVFFGTTLSGRVSYAVGYTGLGVGSTRWGAQMALDLLDGRRPRRPRWRSSAASRFRSRLNRFVRR